ncbi:MAG: hypothetical protein AB1758_15870, partial [Candidatus Eremiobacterota bacterium]
VERLPRARLVVGADGLNSAVRRLAGLEAPSWGTRWGARQHLAVAPATDRVEVHLGHGVEAYLTPVAPNETGVALLWDRRDLPLVPGGEALFPFLLGRIPLLRERFEGAPSVSRLAAVGPFLRRARAPVARGVALVGDAAGYLDAITGEGISLALAQAEALDATLGRALQTGSIQDHDYRAYAAAWTRSARAYRTVTTAVLWLARRPWLAERAIRALSRRPDLLATLLSVNMGTRSLWALLAAALGLRVTGA